MRFRYIALAIIGLAFTQPAQAASKFEVGSKGCMSLQQARAQHPNAHLRYRLIQADKCWYDEVSLKAKTWLEVATHCLTLQKARDLYPSGKLKYRTVHGEKCWYDPEKPLPDRVAGEGAVPSTHAAGSIGATPSKDESARGQPAARADHLDDELENIFLVLCGGPCPQVANPPGYLLKRR